MTIRQVKYTAEIYLESFFIFSLETMLIIMHNIATAG